MKLRSNKNHYLDSIPLDPRILHALSQFLRRTKLRSVLRGISIFVVFFVIAFGVLAAIDYVWLIDEQTRFIGSMIAYGLTLLVGILWIARPLTRLEELRETAINFEKSEPKLRNHLLAAVELGDGVWEHESASAGSPQLRQLLQRRVATYISSLSIASLVPFKLIRPWIATAGLVVGLLTILMLIPGSPLALLYARALAPTANLARASSTKIHIVQPDLKSAYVPANETLVVQASVRGHNIESATMEVRLDSSSTETTPLQRVDDAHSDLFNANLQVLERPLEFRIFAGDAITAWYRLNPYRRPEITALQLEVIAPDYARLDSTTHPIEKNSTSVLAGSTCKMVATLNQPIRNAELELLSGSTVDAANNQERLPLGFKTLNSVGHDFGKLDSGTEFKLHFVGTETGFENKFPERYSVETIEDRPPIAKLILGSRTPELAPPRDILPLTIELRDELPVDETILEFAINDQSWRPFPIQPKLEIQSSSNASQFRVIQGVSSVLDLAALSLSEGNQLRVRLSATDRKSQTSLSNEGRVLITSDYFTDQRYNFVNARLRWLMLVNRWAQSEGADIGIQDLVEESKLLISSCDESVEAIEVEWLTRAAVSIENPSSLQKEQLKDAKERIATAAQWFVAYTVGAVIASDVRELLKFAERAKTKANQDSPERNLRQLELLLANYESCIVKYEQLHQEMPESTQRAIRGLTDQWHDLGQRIDSALVADDQRRVINELVFQVQQLESRQTNPLIDGGITGAAMNALRSMHQIMINHGSLIADVAKSVGIQSDLKQQQVNLVDAARAAELQEKRSQSNADFRAQLIHLNDQLVAAHSIHAKRLDLLPVRLDDLNLIQRSLSSVLQETFDSLEPEQALRKIAGAVAILDSGIQFIEMDRILRNITLDERWSQEPLTLRLQNPKRWDYWGRGIELTVSQMRSAGFDTSTVRDIDQLRYHDPAGMVGRVIGNRRWDKSWRNRASDDADALLAKSTKSKLQVEQAMENARELLREFLSVQQQRNTGDSGDEGTQESAVEANAQQLARLPLVDIQELLDRAETSSAEEMLRALEEQLKSDPPMQKELSDITEQIVEDAIAQLERAATEEYSSQRSLEQSDDAVREERELFVRQLQMLAQQIDQLTNNLVQQGRSVAGRGTAKEAIDNFSKAEELLRKASQSAREANGSMLTAELSERANDISRLLNDASQTVREAEKAAAEKSNELLESERDRARTRDQMQLLQQRANEQLARGTEQISRQWEQVSKNYENQLKNIERQVRDAEKRLEKAEASQAKQPDESRWQNEIAETKQAIDKLQTEMRALEDMVRRTKQLSEAAMSESEKIRTKQLSELSANNPAAELAERFANQVADMTDKMSKSAEQVGNQLNAIPGIQAEQNQLGATAQQQSEIQRQVNQVADALERAARHQQRLGMDESGLPLQQAAEGIRRTAAEEIEDAKQMALQERQQLNDAGERASQPTKGKEIAEAVAKARRSIKEQLQNLSESTISAGNQQSAGRPQNSSSQSEKNAAASQQAAKVRARVLDDLDRALNSEGTSDVQQESRTNNPEPSAMSQSSTLAQTAAEKASLTAQASLAAQAQQQSSQSAFQSDQVQTQPGQSLTPQGTMNSTPNTSPFASDFSDRSIKSLENWGDLREQRTDDSSEARRRSIPDKYRQQIEAYFRSISERAKR